MRDKSCRKIKVYEATSRGYHAVPQIRLEGKWLQELGFNIGDILKVQCKEGWIMISHHEGDDSSDK